MHFLADANFLHQALGTQGVLTSACCRVFERLASSIAVHVPQLISDETGNLPDVLPHYLSVHKAEVPDLDGALFRQICSLSRANKERGLKAYDGPDMALLCAALQSQEVCGIVTDDKAFDLPSITPLTKGRPFCIVRPADLSTASAGSDVARFLLAGPATLRTAPDVYHRGEVFHRLLSDGLQELAHGATFLGTADSDATVYAPVAPYEWLVHYNHHISNNRSSFADLKSGDRLIFLGWADPLPVEVQDVQFQRKTVALPEGPLSKARGPHLCYDSWKPIVRRARVRISRRRTQLEHRLARVQTDELFRQITDGFQLAVAEQLEALHQGEHAAWLAQMLQVARTLRETAAGPDIRKQASELEGQLKKWLRGAKRRNPLPSLDDWKVAAAKALTSPAEEGSLVQVAYRQLKLLQTSIQHAVADYVPGLDYLGQAQDATMATSLIAERILNVLKSDDSAKTASGASDALSNVLSLCGRLSSAIGEIIALSLRCDIPISSALHSPPASLRLLTVSIRIRSSGAWGRLPAAGDAVLRLERQR